MVHICENDMIQLKDIFQIVAAWLQFSTDEYSVHYVATACRPVTCVGHPNDNLHNSTLSVHSALFPCHILSLGQVGILAYSIHPISIRIGFEIDNLNAEFAIHS